MTRTLCSTAKYCILVLGGDWILFKGRQRRRFAFSLKKFAADISKERIITHEIKTRPLNKAPFRIPQEKMFPSSLTNCGPHGTRIQYSSETTGQWTVNSTALTPTLPTVLDCREGGGGCSRLAPFES